MAILNLMHIKDTHNMQEGGKYKGRKYKEAKSLKYIKKWLCNVPHNGSIYNATIRSSVFL